MPPRGDSRESPLDTKTPPAPMLRGRSGAGPTGCPVRQRFGGRLKDHPPGGTSTWL